MLKLLDTLCNISGASGDEERVCEFIQNEIRGHVDTMEIDSMGNLIVFKKGMKKPSKKIMVCAHMDEVGFIIKSITSDGYIKFGFVGGINPEVVIGKRVKFGSVCGVIGIKAVHLTTADERKTNPKVDALYIDIGAKDKEDALKIVSIGDYGTFDSVSYEFGDGFYKAKAIDDRFGCTLMIEYIKKEIPYDMYFSFNVQEETGLRGAMTSTYKIKPDIAVVLESTTAVDFTDIRDDLKVTRLGEGAVVSFMDRATIYNEELFNKITKLAEKNDIKWQTKTVLAGGNDSGAIHKSVGGVDVISISVPTRYLHSPSCVAKISDMEEVQKLLELFLKEGI